MTWTFVAQLAGLMLVGAVGARHVVEGLPRRIVVTHEKAADQ